MHRCNDIQGQRSFCTINRAVPADGESRSEVKTMIYIIGISYSTEYAIKGVYENTIGRVFEWIRGEARAGDTVLIMGARDPALPHLTRAVFDALATR